MRQRFIRAGRIVAAACVFSFPACAPQIERVPAAPLIQARDDMRDVPGLIERLGSGKYVEDHWDAADSLVEIGTKAGPSLTAALRNPDSNVRAGAAFVLGKLGYAPAIQSLIEALGSTDARFNKPIVYTYRSMMRTISMFPSERAYESMRGNVRFEAAYALGKMKAREALRPLMEALDDPEMLGREGAALALGMLKDPAAVQALSRRLEEDPESPVRCHAASALGEIGDSRALPALERALKDKEGGVRLDAAEAIILITGRGGTSGLALSLRDPDRNIRQAAARMLGSSKDPQAGQLLLGALSDPDRDVRGEAAEQLGERKEARAIRPLISILRIDDDYLRHIAEVALGKIGAPAFQDLIVALQDPEHNVRLIAADLLGKLGDARAVDALERAKSDPNQYVRMAVEMALEDIRRMNR